MGRIRPASIDAVIGDRPPGLGPPWEHDLAGRIELGVVAGRALVGNHLGDPADRPVLVQLPPGYDDDPKRRYPSVYVLQGYAGMLTDWSRRTLLRPTTPELVDTAFRAGDAPGCIVVWVDAWTRLGGSQFLDSAGTGAYQTYLCEDVVAFVDAAYRTLPAAAHRGVLGLSSGGYGAAMAAMARPEVFGAFASHAGDASFETCLAADLARAYRLLRDRYDRDFAAWEAALAADPAVPGPDEFPLLMIHALSACYSPAPDGRPLLPFDPATGDRREDVFARWLALDPLNVAPARADACASLRAVWIDAGRDDDYHLDLGAERLARALRGAGAPLVVHELFPGTHQHLARRYPLSVAFLSTHLAET